MSLKALSVKLWLFCCVYNQSAILDIPISETFINTVVGM